MSKIRLFGIIPTIDGERDGIPAPGSIGCWKFVNPDENKQTEALASLNILESDHDADECIDLNSEQLQKVLSALETSPSKSGAPGSAEVDDEEVSFVSVDVKLQVANQLSQNSWTLGGGLHGKFGTRQRALHSLGIHPIDEDGSDIGVIIVDGGLTREYITKLGNSETYGGGWLNIHSDSNVPRPGKFKNHYGRTADGHGNMIARNILSVAPAVTIYDAPILPDRVLDLEAYSSTATCMFKAIRFVIEHGDQYSFLPKHKHWIIVNAWSVANSMSQPSGALSYIDNRNHRLNNTVISLANMPNVEMVFAAGNSGAFQPARFAGPYDRGHGRSIWGCNGLPEVHTIGAVRTDGYSIGASSQGPSKLNLMAPKDRTVHSQNKKPDYCSPSWFCEDDDATVWNTGTSAASALFAGVLATIAARGKVVSSQDISRELSTMIPQNIDWTAQRGYGPIKAS